MKIRLFNTLEFKRQDIDSFSGHLRNSIHMKALVPGVNSRAYTKALYIYIVQRKPFRFWRYLKWKFGSEEVMHASITLTPEEMIKLRDEINQILRLPFNEANTIREDV